MKEIIRLFPDSVKDVITTSINEQWSSLEEIRLRLNKPIELIFTNVDKWLDHHVLTEQMINYILSRMSDYSLYRMEDELREGYITIEGGHRVGLAGEVTTQNGIVKQIQHITFLNIRIAKQIHHVALPIIPFLIDHHKIYNTIVIGAPQTGKTTLIRDIARLMSDGWEFIKPKKVSIIDERSEIAASLNGVPQHEIGLRTDVMDACPKSTGIIMMIRSMSPDVLIVDEIGKEEDVKAILEAVYAGVNIVCSVHGQSISDIKNRPSVKKILKNNIFQRIVLLEKYKNDQFGLTVYNENEHELYASKGLAR